MKTFKICLSIGILITYSSFTSAQIKINHRHFIDLFNSGNYAQLYKEAHDIRMSKEYGKNWAIDYYMAISLCGGRLCRDAERGFSYIEKEYPLNNSQKKLISDGRKFCTQGEGALENDIQYANLIKSISGMDGYPLATVTGKIGLIYDSHKYTEPFVLDHMTDQSELEKRLFEINKKAGALEYYKNLLPPGKYNVDTLGRFIIMTMSPKNLNDADLKKAALDLKKTYMFYSEHYSIRPPNYLIAVYLMGSPQGVKQVAKIVHNIDIPSYIYGYSCLADLSLLGNSLKSGLGTIRHEMFHLMIRTDLGDIPGWLDEGIACMYEESHWAGDILTFDSKVWRTDVLRHNSDNGNPLPLLSNMINNNWDEFSRDKTITAGELSVNYAIAKHFAMYLESKNQLLKVVDAFRNRINIFVDTAFVDISPVQVLENAMNSTLPQIQNDFDSWLKTSYGISANRSREKIMDRISFLDEMLRLSCIHSPDYITFNNEFEKLRGELGDSPQNIPDELVERSIKFIAEGERLYLECNK